MSTTLAELVSRLESAVAARDGVPSAEQYEQAVKDAVDDYSDRNSMRKVTTLSIVAGTAEYDLPDDFLRVIRLTAFTAQDGAVVTSAGLVPVGPQFQETFHVAGGKIVFYPTPQYTMARDLFYAAGYVLDDDDAYQDLMRDDARIALLKAQAIALGWQVNAARAAGGWKYQIGDEMVDKSQLGAGLGQQADAKESEYLAAVKAKVGSVGMRGDFGSEYVGQWRRGTWNEERG